MSATTINAKMMLTCPSRNVWRTGSNISTGTSRTSDHHKMVRRSSDAHTARRDTITSARTQARFTHENVTSATRRGEWANGAKSSAENGG